MWHDTHQPNRHQKSTRISEYIGGTRLDSHHSLVTKHSTEMKHLNFDTVEFVDNVQAYVPCTVRKANNEITKCPYNWNLEDE
jgi:hypothetical protein